MVCPDCGAKLGGVPTHQPCTSCGGSGRDALVTASIYVGVVASSPEVEVELDPHRPWYQKWSNTLRALDSLETAYGRAPAGGNVEVDARVERFFSECNDMRDWLKADKVNLPSLTDQDVMDHAFGEKGLRVCNGIANTHKHHTVTQGQNPVTARIQRTTTSDSGASVRIEYSSLLDPILRYVDAQHLARACVASWRLFLEQHRISPP